MLVPGEWLECDDGIVRPVMRGEVLRADGGWEPDIFLLDTGADRTVLCGAISAALAVPTSDAGRLGGIGGVTGAVSMQTQVRLTKGDGRPIILRGEYAALTDPAALDMSVLGRDVTGLFAVVVDCPGNYVALVSQRHTYHITATT